MTLLAFGFGIFIGMIISVNILNGVCPKGFQLYEDELRKLKNDKGLD